LAAAAGSRVTAAEGTYGFETERLVLRPFTEDDVQEVHELLDFDPDVRGMTLEERKRAIAFRATQVGWDQGIGSYAIVERTSGRIVGYGGLQLHLLPTRPLATAELEVFCGLGRPHRGQGYALEVCTMLRDHAFGTLHVGRLVSVTARGNERAVHLMRRLGASVEDHPADPDLVIGVLARSASSTVRAH
jgi:RimJ/RimL family protein N-acetyltransferase